MSSIPHNLQVVHDAITLAARRYDRNPTEIALLAVSKTFSANEVVQALQVGQKSFGENYLQEAIDKMQQVEQLRVELSCTAIPEWHFIGPIQSNKTRPIAEHFSWVHSVDREKIASRLSEQRPEALGDLQICLQVNISGEASKSGVDPDQLLELAQRVQVLPRLRLRGLMAVPEASEDIQVQRAAFQRLAQLGQTLIQKNIPIDTLSMGMSGDMEAAIAEGSTMLRVGSAIFGKRNYAV
ncbi:YggS family pyridoxal phosphate-dependent enzyme [Undibacterium sp. Di24W]|uniref:YggS family pyridoxal phosphate-dependent enzyme n=1 Tax=Undibacterium sp. Di24W TaxID=3413033 RepID=UPI003BF014D4